MKFSIVQNIHIQKVYLSCISNPEDTERKELHPIPGSPPDLLNISDGCPFVDRCEDAMNICPLIKWMNIVNIQLHIFAHVG